MPIIQMTTYKISTPGPTPPEPWTPGANTILYLPLESDVVDQSGKTGRTFTTRGLTYTTVGGVPSVHIGTTGGISLTSPNPLIDSQNMDRTKQTISLLYYVTTQQSSSRRVLLEFAKNSSEYFSIVLKESTSLVQYSDAYGWYGTGTTIVPNQWNNIIVTCDSDVTDSRKIYVNGQLAWSGVNGNTPPRGSRPNYSEENQIILNSRDGLYASGGLNGNARELILEDKVWSADEVSAYYTSIKNELGF